jgi:hypothetical protein
MTRRTGNFWRFLVVSATLFLGAALTAGPASAAFGIASFDGEVSNADGTAATQAGSHPYEASTTIRFNTHPDPELFGFPVPDASERSVKVSLPPGLVGNPTATPTTCTEEQLAAQEKPPLCPATSQVGVATLWGPLSFAGEERPIYNMATPDSVPALFGFNYLGVPVHLTGAVRTGGDYGTDVISANVPEAIPIIEAKIALWGVPADPGHDEERAACLTDEVPGTTCPSDAPRVPFISNPTSCTAPGVGLETKLEITPWVDPTDVQRSSFFSHLSPPDQATQQGPTGCDLVPFSPKLSVTPTSPLVAGAPSGFAFDLHVPQPQNPDGLTQANLRRAVVQLPVGMTVNAASADGLTGCSEAQVALDDGGDPTCPLSSKIGDVEIRSPLLRNPMEGSVYLAQQGTNPFRSLLALYLVAQGQGTTIKLAGKVEPDPQSGQLTTTFDDDPQLPFEDLKLTFKDGPRAPLVSPPTCGAHTTTYELTSWSGKLIAGSDSFSVDQNCGASSQFTPSLEAGTANPTGGSYSPFTLRITRPDGEQNVASLEAKPPKGLLAKLAGVPLCGDAQAAVGDCPSDSQVGKVTVGTGSGSSPLYVPESGKAPTAVYLAGPYKGAPYSLVVKVPAQAGPFDLGTVAVRNALFVDPVTTQVTAKSDPLPQILQGIPITYRDVRVEVTRSEFIVNPTNCDPMSLDSTITGAGGATAMPSARFQAASCASLGFAPKLAMSVRGKTRRAAHPAFKAVLTPPPGQANIARAAVSLPPTEFLENAHIRTVCTRVQYAAGPGGGAECPKGSIYGRAKAWTPLLDRPLEGPVFLRSSDHKLPDLVASLSGQIHIDLDGRIDSPHKRIRNTFEMVPDAPVSRFVLEMQGGRKGLLVNNTQLCKAKPKGTAVFTGQNGKQVTLHPAMKAECGGKKGGKRKKKH